MGSAKIKADSLDVGQGGGEIQTANLATKDYVQEQIAMWQPGPTGAIGATGMDGSIGATGPTGPSGDALTAGPFVIPAGQSLQLDSEAYDGNSYWQVDYVGQVIRGNQVNARIEFSIFYRDGSWEISPTFERQGGQGAASGMTFTVNPATGFVYAAADNSASDATLSLRKTLWLALAPPVAWAPDHQSGLSLWVRPDSFDQASSTWMDLSSNGNHLTAGDGYSAPEFEPVSNSVHYTGVNDLAVASNPSLEFGTGDMILAVRIRPYDLSRRMIAGKDTYANGSSYTGIILMIDGGPVLLTGVRNDSINSVYVSASPGVLANSDFHTVIVTRKNNQVTLYLDLNQIAQGYEAPGPANITNNAPFHLGRGDLSTTAFNGWFKGAIVYRTTPTDALLLKINNYMSNL